MCGLTGVIDLSLTPVDPCLVLAMTDTVRHRGPDDEGYVVIDQRTSQSVEFSGKDSPPETRARFPLASERSQGFAGNIGLGHRRFSIIDLTSGGHQPFFDQNRRCCAVFNGEIYNYVEVRATLEGLGVAFRTQSDTEVLVEAYKAWGTDCFSRLNGFWAIALYDFARRELILCRDRIGKKPLYWTRCGSRIYFASEIKALLAVPEVDRRKKVNEAAIQPWLACALRDVDDATFFEGVYSLPAGSWAVVDERFPDGATSFWSVPRERLSEADVDPREAAETLRELLIDATRIRLRADVPWCVELSGGMDSSALAAIAAGLSPEPITTYTVRFEDPAHNEEPFARSVAQAIGADYRVVDSPLERFWPQIDAFTRLHEEPYHSPVLQTNQVIWTLMRAQGTKVSLNGAAGDELFGGYSRYFYLAQIDNARRGRLRQLLANEIGWSEAPLSWRPTGIPVVRLARHVALRALFSRGSEMSRMDTAASGRGERAPLFPSLDDTLYEDMTRTLMPYWLRSGDKDYMGIPFEVRAPFLDYRVIEFAMRLPTTLLIRDGWHKWILRKALEGVVPDDVLWRPKKMGFPFPLAQFYSDGAPIIAAIRRGASNPFVDASSLEAGGHASWYALSFALWYERFFNGNDALFDEIERLAASSGSSAGYGFSPEFLGVSEAI
jgi:asparagine synthase (glutamine-hydrolysing)